MSLSLPPPLPSLSLSLSLSPHYCFMDMSSVGKVQMCSGRAIARVQRNLSCPFSISLGQGLDYIPSHSRIGGVSKLLSIRVELSNQAAAGAEGRGRWLYSRGVWFFSLFSSCSGSVS